MAASSWVVWVTKHADRLHSFDELTEDQCVRLASDLGYASCSRMLRCVEACAIDGSAFIRVSQRQLCKPLELLAVCAHELVHCMLPSDMNVAIEEAICMVVERCVTKSWLVDADLIDCLRQGATMHPANRLAAGEAGGLQRLQRALVEFAAEGGPLAALSVAETVQATLKRLDIEEAALRVCCTPRERRQADLLESEAFSTRGLPGPLGGDELVLVHGTRCEPMRTILRVRTEGTVLYVGAFVSAVTRAGHGTVAMDLLVRLALARGIACIELHSEDLPRLRLIYKKLYFTICARVADYYGDGRAALLWRRELR